MAKRSGTAALLLVAALGAVAGLAWRGAPGATASAAATPAATSADGESLRQAVLAADAGVKTDADVLEAARLIQGAIRVRPERAGDLAEMLPSLRSRGLAFRLALMLGAHVREARVFADGLEDSSAAPAVRASHAFLVSSMIADLDPAEREEARKCARKVAPDASQDKAFRSEAIGVLDAEGADHALLQEILAHDAERTVALSAARILLVRGGATEAEVKAGLLRFADGSKDADLTSRSLDAILRDLGADDRGSTP